MATEISNPGRLDRILLTLGVLSTKIDNVGVPLTALTERVNQLEAQLHATREEVVTLKANDNKSNANWLYVWQAINTFLVLLGVVAAYLRLHGGG